MSQPDTCSIAMTSFGPSRPRSPSFPVRALQGATLLGTSSRPPAGARAPPPGARGARDELAAPGRVARPPILLQAHTDANEGQGAGHALLNPVSNSNNINWSNSNSKNTRVTYYHRAFMKGCKRPGQLMNSIRLRNVF